MPERIQLRRTKGWRKPEGAIVVSRPSKWGNPYKVGARVVDPVNGVNPIASTSIPLGSASAGHEIQRIAFDGTRYVQRMYRIKDAATAVELYRRLMVFEGWDLSELRGHDLACWCPLDQPCHADVLLELANR